MANSKESEAGWVDVAFTKATKVEVKSGVKDNAFLKVAKEKGFVQVNQEACQKEMVLKPSTRYEFRVAAVNSMGVGPWSEVTTLKTLTPGAPQAPINVKISNSLDGTGASVTWDVPPCQHPILDYAVFLCIKCENGPTSSGMGTPKNSMFKQVYQGSENKCHVKNDHIAMAAIEKLKTGKNAVIFRIAARNVIGYGSATQVRWLQDNK